MAEKGEGASAASASTSVPQGSNSDERVIRINAEDYSLEGKDYTSVKVICLGDSAVGKSK